jgi:hypothetical protein
MREPHHMLRVTKITPIKLMMVGGKSKNTIPEINMPNQRN